MVLDFKEFHALLFKSLFAGSATLITSDDLVATDIDSEDVDLLYTLEADVTIGTLRYVNGRRSKVISATGTRTTFTQGDIDSGECALQLHCHVTESLILSPQ